MFKNKKVVMFITILAVILILLSASLYYYISSQKLPETPATPLDITEQQKIEVLKELNNTSSKPILKEERSQILKDLNTGAKKSKITNTDRAKLLDLLNQE